MYIVLAGGYALHRELLDIDDSVGQWELLAHPKKSYVIYALNY